MIIAKGLQDSVTMTGYLSEQEMRDHLQRAWVLTYPSPKEGWGLCVVEAGACGTPSVASDSPGLCEAVKEGETGFLVLHGDVAALSEKLLLLLRDESLRAKMSEAALERARQFSWKRTATESLMVVECAARGDACG
jgi:glycosyltransferase involved in cell wall biosynthesis